MKDKEIINRWKNVQSKNILKNNRILSPFGNFDNKEDLRGISFMQEKVKDFIFDNIDFSLSSFKNSWIENTEFKSCIFFKVDFSELSDHSNTFIHCSFIHCKFNKSAIGYGGSKYTNCIFSDCNFTGSTYIRTEFTDCKFENCKIKNIDYNASSFENCSFEGELDSVWFRGRFALKSDEEIFGKPRENTMKNVSFFKVIMSNMIYSDNCSLSTVLIDTNKGYYKFDNWFNRLKYLQSQIPNFDFNYRKIIEIFVNSYLVHAKSQDWYIVSKKDLLTEYGELISDKIIKILNNYGNVNSW